MLSPLASSLDPQPEDTWVAHPMYVSPYAGSSSPIGYSPAQMRNAYNLPSNGGNGTTIAIVDAYHTPNLESYFNTFSNQYGLPDNTTGNLIVHSMTSATNSDWALETCLDVEWAHAIAPQAKILLVEAANEYSSSLLAAIDYATSQPGVVAVSLSWGGPEYFGETFQDSHFNKAGITFFVASGDDGTNVNWPAASAYVVSVGGTTLNLNPDGSVISETAWKNSSGGVSSYVAKPSFQTSFGLNYTRRAVPDVSYNGNATTGVSVYMGSWYKVGGTSAGAPQWAAIHAIGQSANNTNLYARAKASYSSYLRDITQGSNYKYNAAVSYDLVTGLGSPLTTNFGTQVTVSPTEGSAYTPLTITGSAFAGSSVNISYLNPLNSSWITVVNNLPTTSQSFTYTLSAPDLSQANPAGDNTQASDSIIFKVTDNSNGRTYNASTPFVEYRRGLTQVGSASASGIFGNNTNLASSVFVQPGENLPLSGKCFQPGTASLLWDSIIIGAATVNADGQFSVTVSVPQSEAGQHTLTINDGAVAFAVTITRAPTIVNNYTDTWRTSEFTVNLTADSSVNDIFYSINGGDTHAVSVDGLPQIITEGADNTLEYWISWSSPGTGATEVHYAPLSGIKLDKTAPTGSISSSVGVTVSPTVTLNLYADDATSGVSLMRLANEDDTWTSWLPYTTQQSWTLSSGIGVKTVYVQYMDNAGLTSPVYGCTVTVQNPQASSNAYATTEPTATPTETSSPTDQPSTTPDIPELQGWMVPLLLAASAVLMLTLFLKKRSS